MQQFPQITPEVQINTSSKMHIELQNQPKKLQFLHQLTHKAGSRISKFQEIDQITNIKIESWIVKIKKKLNTPGG